LVSHEDCPKFHGKRNAPLTVALANHRDEQIFEVEVFNSGAEHLLHATPSVEQRAYKSMDTKSRKALRAGAHDRADLCLAQRRNHAPLHLGAPLGK